MGSVSVVYKAPEGDNKVVETRGLTFFDGQAQTLDEDEHVEFLAKAKNNQHFTIDGKEPKPGKEPKHDVKAGMADASDHDFEQDRRDTLAPRRGRPPGKSDDK